MTIENSLHCTHIIGFIDNFIINICDAHHLKHIEFEIVLQDTPDDVKMHTTPEKMLGCRTRVVSYFKRSAPHGKQILHNIFSVI